jgi:formate hydrogenlyase subunit 3/multisubunit Na+/H+ antiporter MnhD subunit
MIALGISHPSPTQDALLILPIILPVAGVLLAVPFGRHAERIALATLPLGLIAGIAVLAGVWQTGQPMTYALGAWLPPLGIALQADGISAVMLVSSAAILLATGIFARDYFPPAGTAGENRRLMVFWTLLMAVWAALNTVFLGRDLFNLYVALELLTFAAVPLVSLDGRAETLEAALRYLLFALAGSVLYLLGLALLYGAYGTLDIGLLSERSRPDHATVTAAALMTAGLMAKTALFPLHLWLPPAHAGAPAPASAILSSLVVKASFFLIVRIWFEALPAVATQAAAQLLGILGGSAIIVGSVVALRQIRLKMLIAYSTVAQIGYLFLIFPLAIGADASAASAGVAWTGGWMQLLSHAFAKAAMFLSAGLIAQTLGHDRISELGGIGRARPIALAAFGIGGLSLMGIPPSGGFVAKWLLLSAAAQEAQWWWALVILLGGLLAGAYVFRVLVHATSEPKEPQEFHAVASRRGDMVALALALCAVALGAVPLEPSTLLEIGRPATAAGIGP